MRADGRPLGSRARRQLSPRHTAGTPRPSMATDAIALPLRESRIGFCACPVSRPDEREGISGAARRRAAGAQGATVVEADRGLRDEDAPLPAALAIDDPDMKLGQDCHIVRDADGGRMRI